MIKGVNCNAVFPNRKCIFKSISGGLTRHCHEYVKSRELLLANCKYFIVVCGSNDCDMFYDINKVIMDYLEFAQYLSKMFPRARLIFNKLVPRLRTKNRTIEEFELRRVCFNNFLEQSLPNIIPCTIVTHDIFERKEKLKDFLSDGVHFSPLRAIPIYENNLRQVVDALESR